MSRRSPRLLTYTSALLCRSWGSASGAAWKALRTSGLRWRCAASRATQRDQGPAEPSGRWALSADDLAFLTPTEQRNPRFTYGARQLSYDEADLRRVLARKRATGTAMLGRRALRALCAALGVPTATACGAIAKQQMLIRARLALDPRGHITRRRQRP